MRISEDNIFIWLRRSNGTVKYSVSSKFTFIMKIVGILHV